MAISPGRVVERVNKRIAASEYRLTVYYAVAVAKPTGIGPIAMPASPLLKTVAPVLPTGAEPTWVKAPVEMPCLFTEISMLGEARRDRLTAEMGGWTRETTALARVLEADGALPEGGTVFDACSKVEVNGQAYRVLNIGKVTSGMTTAGTYYLMLQWAGTR